MANKEQTVNGFPFDSTRIDRNMNIKYETLASDLLQKISTKANYQHWVGIAGPPGAGKSTLSAVSQLF